MDHRPDAGFGELDNIAALRTRADAGDRNSAGRLGELLARQGDCEGAVRRWTLAYGDEAPTTKRLAELLAELGDVKGAAEVWRWSDRVYHNPAGLHAQYLQSLDSADRLEWDDPEDWGFIEMEQLARLLSERGDGSAIAELRTRASGGDPAAARQLALRARRGEQQPRE